MATATVEDSLNDIIGRLELKKQIQELIESIVLPMAMTMLMPHQERIRKFPPGILLHGPPGTGKPVVTGKMWRRQAAYRRH